MICDSCFDREDCPKRALGCRHIDSCTLYFPDLRQAACRKPELPARYVTAVPDTRHRREH